MYRCDPNGQLSMLDAGASEKAAEPQRRRLPKQDSELISIPYFHLDLKSGHVDLFGQRHWELRSPYRHNKCPLNTGAAPRRPIRASLSGILEAFPALKYYLSKTACIGILRRAFERGKELPKKLARALKIQAGLMQPDGHPTDLKAFHVNQRDEGIDLQGVSGALMATNNMQMQTFVTQPDEAAEGFDGYNGDLTGDVAATLGVNCGMSTDRNGVMNFAANQQDEVRDLHDVAGALGAQQGMKQQTFVAEGVVTKGNGDCFLTPEQHTALTAGGGQAGQGYPCVLTAAFSAGQGCKAGGIGYQAECSPTLKAAESGTNMVPSVLCLNDQGGSVMECSENVSGTLRAQEHGHQPLVYENHGIDSRYTGPHKVAPTMSARYGTGGNNVPLVEQEADAICIAGNTVDRQPQNGGNGLGCQDELAYTLTATDRHAVYSRQRVDAFKGGEVVSTQSARQYKDATDLVMDVAGLDCRNASENGDLCGTLQKGTSGSSLNSIHPVRNGLLIRRLTPLECERLQGFPDSWTEIPNASDSARYKALGNSVAIPCVEFIMEQVAAVQRTA